MDIGEDDQDEEGAIDFNKLYSAPSSTSASEQSKNEFD